MKHIRVFSQTLLSTALELPHVNLGKVIQDFCWYVSVKPAVGGTIVISKETGSFLIYTVLVKYFVCCRLTRMCYLIGHQQRSPYRSFLIVQYSN